MGVSEIVRAFNDVCWLSGNFECLESASKSFCAYRGIALCWLSFLGVKVFLGIMFSDSCHTAKLKVPLRHIEGHST